MSTSILELRVSVVHSNWDEALGSEAILRTVEDSIDIISNWIECVIKDKIPEEKACSIVFASKRLKGEE